ncbi:MAG: ABC transporter ATP-binding protein/permease [bacterium]|nr:ABC transporter ATP-binding protein/permease [bacterium]MCM1374745.1 ABC transporter ATP-binding protein/permease [Muribaculum sp.]
MKSKCKALAENGIYVMRMASHISRGYLILLLLQMLLGTAGPILASVLSKYLLDELGGDRGAKELILLTVAILIAGAGVAALQSLLRTKCMDLEVLVNHQFDVLLQEKTAAMDYELIESKEMQEKRELAQSGIHRIGGVSGYLNTLLTLFTSTITMIAILVLFWGVNLMAPAMILLVRGLTIYLDRQREKRQYEFSQDNDRLNLVFSYTYFMTHDERAAMDSRVYDLIPLYRKKMHGLQEESYRNNRKGALAECRYSSLLSLAKYGYLLAAYSLFVVQAITEPLFTIGSLSMAVSLTNQFDAGLKSFIENAIKLVYQGKYIADYRSFLAQSDRLSDTGTEQLPAESSKLTFRFEQVCFRYPGSTEDVLKNVSCEIIGGQKTALVGENGSGKSTFIKLLCRLYEPTGGRITLNGRDIREYSCREYRRAIAAVFQDYDMVPFSVRENVNLSAQPENCDPAVEEALRAVGMLDRITALPQREETYAYSRFHEQGVNFSGGEKQKLAIARALYRDAPIMILDEPTAALDPRSEYEIFEMFRSRVQQKTAILISHRLSSCRICDRILVFREGELVQTGTHDSLREADGLYRALWEAQARHYVEETA